MSRTVIRSEERTHLPFAYQSRLRQTHGCHFKFTEPNVNAGRGPHEVASTSWLIARRQLRRFQVKWYWCFRAGARGAYQGGVYQALHEAGIEPNWVIGTSIGAINGAIIAGNEPGKRLSQISKFWDRMERKPIWDQGPLALIGGNVAAQMMTIFGGIAGYFTPNRDLAWGLHAPIGVERAGFYTIEALHETLNDIVDLSRINSGQPRLTVGAVNVRSGRMHYFDSRNMPITLKHVLASGALPPAFPAVCIDGDPYWDGGIYSNTPIETVFDDHPRRDSIVFTVQMWHAEGPEPESVWQVLNRQKDIQYASRADSHIARQEHIHQLRHIVRELVRLMPDAQRETPEVKEMAGFGCGTFMHIVRLKAPRLDHEDHLRDIDFTSAGIHARWQAGYADIMRMLEHRPWEAPIDPMAGVAVHDSDIHL